MTDRLPPSFQMIAELLEGLQRASVDLAREMRKRHKAAPRSRGCTLRPGIETPLWNALATAIAPTLGRRGAKSLLARELALHPSRVTQFFVTRKAMPDAERTLELLVWWAKQQRKRR